MKTKNQTGFVEAAAGKQKTLKVRIRSYRPPIAAGSGSKKLFIETKCIVQARTYTNVSCERGTHVGTCVRYACLELL